MSAVPRSSQILLVGQRIRQLRKSRHLTQADLASRIGITQSDLSRMESGEYKVGLDTLLKILGTFNLGIGEFFEETNAAESVIDRYRLLSTSAQREVESFIEFKRRQEEEAWDDDGGESEGDDV